MTMNPRPLFIGFVVVLATISLLNAGEPIVFQARSIESHDGREERKFAETAWAPENTAVVVCDMWTRHWCDSASRRGGEMAPRINQFLKAMRKRGALVIHCPSSGVDFYQDTPMRKRAKDAPAVKTNVPLQGWCSLDEKREAALPIDDSDNGCDCLPRCPTGAERMNRRQNPAIEMEDEDAVTDNAEAYYLMSQRGITNVVVLGVHTNMCVLGRPFSIRQMVYQGQNVALVRDLTDTMYNPRSRPFVPHVRGTELVVDHIERHWCPTLTSADVLGGEPFEFSDAKEAIRSDSVAEKIRLLEQAYRDGRHDLAMSLAESLKDTLEFEQQRAPDRQTVPLKREMTEVSALPSEWAAWAKGWSHCQAVTVAEGAGIARVNEPVHLNIAVPLGAMTDPWREIRVARMEANNALVEIPSQILDHSKANGQHRCEVAFQSNVAAHGEADYLILFGNPNAELPAYASDLKSAGERLALEIENHYFTAHLSKQMGQLERLISKRKHGLELYAGGKGHGEPPTIDWAHDYVDKGHFQKLRIKNWAESPNYEVIRGPVCIQVRRWGFPHSPIHPLFTPSRVHVDQTYTFYSGLPYFFKEGTMEAVKDVEIAAMRDDEWVFSGYSFDETLWIDRQSNVHEGKVPGEHTNDLWGVGFFHRTSRDAFVALWLEHDAGEFPIHHGGAPTLDYDGHGQLWSRYPANEATLKAGTVFRQRSAYLMTAYTKEGGAKQIAQLRKQLTQPLEIRSNEVPKPAGEIQDDDGRLARPGETEEAATLKTAIWNALREVKDEQLYQIDSNIVDLGYVYDVGVDYGIAKVLVTMPHRGRPVYDFLVTQSGGRVTEGIQERVRRIEGIQDVVVEFTQEPAWNVHRLSELGRRELGISR
jgi:metal-sulfur cluster biosynthetic enzyme/nicotinamidase-related amidase